jgi:(2Fe-2S) ferredoxin
MERCERGPCRRVYPEAVWYRYESTADIDAIIDEHILGGQPVQRLRI